jgi:hypothetical protein
VVIQKVEVIDAAAAAPAATPRLPSPADAILSPK